MTEQDLIEMQRTLFDYRDAKIEISRIRSMKEWIEKESREWREPLLLHFCHDRHAPIEIPCERWMVGPLMEVLNTLELRYTEFLQAVLDGKVMAHHVNSTNHPGVSNVLRNLDPEDNVAT